MSLTFVAEPPEPRVSGAVPPAALTVQLDRCRRRISVRGELDLATVPVLARAMKTLRDLDLDRDPHLDPGAGEIDLSGVTFIDAAGLGCLVDHATRLAAVGAKVSVVGVTPRVHRVFEIAGLGGLLAAS